MVPIATGMKSLLTTIRYKTRYNTIIDPYLLVILLLSAFVRLYHLNGQSIWLDEAYAIKFAELKLSQIYFLHDNTPPLYNAILHWWIQLFGTSEFSVRLPSAILGVLSVFMMYKIGSVLFHVEVGRLSALLMAISVFHIDYSQEARTYSLSVFLALLSMYCFIEAIKKTSNKNVIGYVLSSILLLYSHIYGLFIIIAQNTYFAVLFFLSKEDKRCNSRSWILIQCLLIVLFLPWISIFVHQIQAVQKGFWIAMPCIHTIYESFYSYSSYSKSLMLVFVILAISSTMFIETRRGSLHWECIFESLEGYQWEIRLLNSSKVCFLLVWLIAPIIIPFVISLFLQPIYLIKYTIVALPAFFFLVAKGVSNVHNRYIKSLLVIGITTLSLIHVWQYCTNINKDQWRNVAQYVDTHFRSGDVLIFKESFCIIPFNYYSRNDSIIAKGIDSQPSQSRFSDRSIGAELREINRKEYVAKGLKDDTFIDEGDVGRFLKSVEHYDRIWFVSAHLGDPKEQILESLTSSLNLSVQKKYSGQYGLRLYLFDRRAIQAGAGSH